MTTTCPAGHESSTDDYCDVCGARLGASSVAVPGIEVEVEPAASASAAVTVTASATVEPCPVCATPRGTEERFCEACGFDFVHGQAPAVARTWCVTITADRDYYDRVAPAGVDFPEVHEPRVVALTGDEVTIGRGSRSQVVGPDIDLRDGVEDHGVSHRHARLVRGPDGSYAVVDEGSTNGTTVNGADDPIEPGIPVTVHAGDRVHVGAWTTLIIALGDPPEGSS